MKNRKPAVKTRLTEQHPSLLAFLVLLSMITLACVNAQRKSNSTEQKPLTPGTGTPTPGQTLIGKAAMGDWTMDAPGVRRKITPADLPPPFANPSVDNGPDVGSRPADAWPKAPAGFKVEQYITNLSTPRLIRTAPNGDVFVAESYAGRMRVLRSTSNPAKPDANEVFASGLNKPFGVAFYPPGPNPQFVYIANTDSVVRFPYQNGDLKARGEAQVIVPDIPGGGRLRGGGHWTRDIAFSNDGKRMFVSVGSHSNNYSNPNENEERRADILSYNPDGTGYQLFAYGIRNAVGIAVHPQTGELWASVNERDGLGDNIVPDYVHASRKADFTAGHGSTSDRTGIRRTRVSTRSYAIRCLSRMC